MRDIHAPTPHARAGRAVLASSLLIACLLATAACGGSSTTSSTTSTTAAAAAPTTTTGSASATTAATGTATTTTVKTATIAKTTVNQVEASAYRAKLAAYAACMRSNGIDIPPPTTGANGLPGLAAPRYAFRSQFNEALRKCRAQVLAALKAQSAIARAH